MHMLYTPDNILLCIIKNIIYCAYIYILHIPDEVIIDETCFNRLLEKKQKCGRERREREGTIRE